MRPGSNFAIHLWGDYRFVGGGGGPVVDTTDRNPLSVFAMKHAGG
jgi:hypothetical protein